MPKGKVDNQIYSPPTLFGQWLHRCLVDSNKSVLQFCNDIGLDRQSMLRFLNTDARPNVDILLHLSAALNVDFCLLVVLSRPDAATLLGDQLANPAMGTEQLEGLSVTPDLNREIDKVVARRRHKASEVAQSKKLSMKEKLVRSTAGFELRQIAEELTYGGTLLASGIDQEALLRSFQASAKKLEGIIALVEKVNGQAEEKASA